MSSLKQTLVARQQFGARSEFQNKYHLLSEEGEDTDIKSQIGADQPRDSWMSTVDESMLPANGKNSNVKVYEANHNFHILRFVRMCVTLPTVRVYESYRDTIQICWPENIGHQIIRRGTLYHGQKDAGNLDNVWLDNNLELFVQNKHHYDRMVGNVSCLREWTTELPKYSLTIPQPFYFSTNRAFAIRLFQSKATPTSFVYDLRLKLSELLCMRKKTADGTWKQIPLRTEYLEGKADRTLENPYLMGRYALLTKDEISQFLERLPEESKEEFTKKNSFYIDDVEIINEDDPVKVGENRETDMSDILSPVKAVVITAQNTEAKDKNNHANYTTELEQDKGWNPVSSVTLYYHRYAKLDGEPGYRLSLDYPYYSAPVQPRRAGVNLFCPDTLSLGACGNTLNFHELRTKFRVSIQDTNPYMQSKQEKISDPRDKEEKDLEDEEQGQTDSRTFYLNYHVMHVKKIEYTKDSCLVISKQEEDDNAEKYSGDDITEKEIEDISVDNN